MPSRAMICMIATGRRYLGPFRPETLPLKIFPLGNWLAREPELFHVTLHSSPRIDLQIIINILRQFFYVIVHFFLSPDVKDI